MSPDAARLYFWTRVDQSGGSDACHPWMAGKMNNGYGQYNSRAFGVRTAHSLAYEFSYGEIPMDPAIGRRLDVDHECHNRDTSCRGGKTCKHRLCCNPKHLKLRTTGANRVEADRLRGRGIFTESCPKDHPYDEENTGWTKRTVRGVTKSERYCKACNREKAYLAKHGVERPADALDSLSRAGCPTCSRGHAYDEENTIYTATTGKRRCKKCERLNDLKHKWEKKYGKKLRWCTVEEIGGWSQKGELVSVRALHAWDPGQPPAGTTREILMKQIEEMGGVSPFYEYGNSDTVGSGALKAYWRADGSVELQNGVHRWEVAKALGITKLLVEDVGDPDQYQASFAYP